MNEATAERAARGVETSPPVQWLGRFGGVCYGIVYLVVAWLAVRIAFGDPATEADQRGAVAVIAAQPLGTVLLWVMTVGLIAFGAWQLLYTGTGYRWITKRGKRIGRRIGTAGRALVALAIASFAVHYLTGGRRGGGQQELTAWVLGLPGGRALLMLIGLGVIAACAMSAHGGLVRRFMQDLNTDDMPEQAHHTVELIGAVGYVAKAVAYAVLGTLLCTAAVHLDPRQAGGLDKALRTLAARPYGQVLLLAVAAGFVAFGVYCFADARYRRS
ncbi:MAG TPA: DUF1206 domain-containing protein [Pseudonocardiaceae bacterium]|nr:DUF1206 domain-containing protein [Pseudonocardiaceae bacterium]